MRKIDWFSFKWLTALTSNRGMRERQELYRGVVVDLGCGEAPYKEDMLRTADRYIGVDWGNSFHDLSNIDVQADLNRPLPLADNLADVIHSESVMEHLIEPLSFLRQCERILKPGGLLIILVPFQWQVHEAPYDYFRYTEFGLRALAEKAGFEKISVTPKGGFWTVVGMKTCYFLKQSMPKWLTPLLVPVWFSIQSLILLLEPLAPAAEEAAGYVMTARKTDFLKF